MKPSGLRSIPQRTPPPELPQFQLFQPDATHKTWLKEIQSFCESLSCLLLDTMSLPGTDEPWYAPGFIDIPKLKLVELAGLKESRHIEYPFVLLLQDIQKPSKFNLSPWSNCISCSIHLTAQDFTLKPPPLTNLNNKNLGSHLQILECLTSCKSSAAETIATDDKLNNNMSLKPLHLLHDLIIDIFINYSIIRGSTVADVEMEENAAESQALVLQNKQLDQYCSRHNYTPFYLYLVAGVRGLILAPTNWQFASGALALGFLGAMGHIFKKKIPQRKDLEPVWRRLGPYIDSLFIESFLTPNCLFNFHQPQIIQLAQVILSDFLVCVQNTYLTKQFQILCALTSK
ncbi:uncharacterized protein VP01_1748g6 [Puccinia sorghi]|uniref:Uncharacterized protein n=1 Tax=Puccinia sorghi TaxID=27349 RepID=A0A0L6VF59_9BASI|nr:uncharacterized protein VP01_1748g6 [Puccinia sorghi]